MAIAPRSILVALLSGLLVVFLAPAALAHDRLVGSTPAEGATVTSLDEIELEFSARVRMPVVALRDADDTQLNLGKPKAEGKFVRVEVPEPLAAGKYVIAWRVVSSDGHPIQGEIPFTAKGEPTPTPEAEEDSAAPSAEPSEAATSAAPVEETPDASPVSAESEGLPGWVWIAAAVLALLGVGTFVAGRKGSAKKSG
ncbi:copper resistance protein CopC [Nonomuraea sp. NPDC049649]|uniref:copper resistance CopC family protein n=1 Tax=Nonomuraea sp. NPDC049649 TaxID=3155776 RepID=UPI00343D9AA3